MPDVIVLTKRDGRQFYALVDAVDLGSLTRRVWSEDRGYAVRNEHYYLPSGEQRTRLVSMHREIMGLAADDARSVDHINHNTLDNRRANLRIVTHAENHQNRAMHALNTSGYRGVSWDRSRRKWQAYATVGGRRHMLGRFDTAEGADGVARTFRAEHMPFSEDARKDANVT